MSRRNKKRDTITNGLNANKISNQNGRLSDYLALMPGLLMCFMVFMVLVLDIFMSQMIEDQYEEFQTIFNVMNCLSVISGIIYLIIVHKAIRINSVAYWLFAAFMICIVISTAVNGLTDAAIHGIPYRNIGIFHTFTFIVIYMGVSSMIPRESFKRFILIMYLTVADFVAVSAIINLYMGNIEAYDNKKELSAIFFNGNHYGYFLVMALLIAFGYVIFGNMQQMIFGIISAAINGIAMIINHSFGSILAVFIILIITCIINIAVDSNRRKKTIMLSISIVIIGIAAFLISPDIAKEVNTFIRDMQSIVAGTDTGSAGHNRMKLWKYTVECIRNRPLFGYGCEGISIKMYDEIKIANPHNEILTYAAYYGIPAAVIYTAGVAAVITNAIGSHKKSSESEKIALMAAAGYFISSLVGVGMFYTMPFFYLFLGVSTIKKE